MMVRVPSDWWRMFGRPRAQEPDDRTFTLWHGLVCEIAIRDNYHNHLPMPFIIIHIHIHIDLAPHNNILWLGLQPPLPAQISIKCTKKSRKGPSVLFVIIPTWKAVPNTSKLGRESYARELTSFIFHRSASWFYLVHSLCIPHQLEGAVNSNRNPHCNVVCHRDIEHFYPTTTIKYY